MSNISEVRDGFFFFNNKVDSGETQTQNKMTIDQ